MNAFFDRFRKGKADYDKVQIEHLKRHFIGFEKGSAYVYCRYCSSYKSKNKSQFKRFAKHLFNNCEGYNFDKDGYEGDHRFLKEKFNVVVPLSEEDIPTLKSLVLIFLMKFPKKEGFLC